jgi:hypothetical protein
MELVETTPELFNFDLDKLKLIVNGVSIPLVGTYDELWFPGKELCMVMEYKNVFDALSKYVKPKHTTTLLNSKSCYVRSMTTFSGRLLRNFPIMREKLYTYLNMEFTILP